ncbi:integrase domain-containing protein [Ectothiorhodospira marina]|uniref:Phage integrase, N-terminal n=1 Tax=Ectothiorhodospira marina TaxID=1396821 RepID=A0A1H7RP79_9GAMM|nr:integrase domain-containing protein [Ectothiorhodospira marina]SEL61634.1 Phage integrase, N-terminal [Ectothiorhodospira marina]
MSLKESMIRAARQGGGSTKTKEHRERVVRDYVNFCSEKNIQTKDISNIKVKHIQQYAEYLKEKLDVRSTQNHMSAMRSMLRSAGRTKFADHRDLSNESLGIKGGTRVGTKTALSQENYKSATAKLEARGSHGEAAALQLQRELGLRATEAIMSVQSLDRWEKELQSGADKLTVTHGTKGGRMRDAHVIDRDRALYAIQQARQISQAQGGKLVVTPTPSLSAARSRYEREMRAVGLSGQQSSHSARYAYAQDRIDAYQAAGMCRKEAAAAASCDLGHGPGRGRYIESVYSR